MQLNCKMTWPNLVLRKRLYYKTASLCYHSTVPTKTKRLPTTADDNWVQTCSFVRASLHSSGAFHHFAPSNRRKTHIPWFPPISFVISDFPLCRDKTQSINDVMLLFDCKTVVCMKLLPASLSALRVDERKTIQRIRQKGGNAENR